MKKKIEYTDEPMNVGKIIEDFFPRPEELFGKDDTVNITLTLSQNSIDYFKALSLNYDTDYKTLIRRYLDVYVSKHLDK